MTAKMNHYVACRAEAAVCREKAETNINRRDYWIAEAQKWEKRAERDIGRRISSAPRTTDFR
jgi:hypothetical protein